MTISDRSGVRIRPPAPFQNLLIITNRKLNTQLEKEVGCITYLFFVINKFWKKKIYNIIEKFLNFKRV